MRRDFTAFKAGASLFFVVHALVTLFLTIGNRSEAYTINIWHVLGVVLAAALWSIATVYLYIFFSDNRR